MQTEWLPNNEISVHIDRFCSKTAVTVFSERLQPAEHFVYEYDNLLQPVKHTTCLSVPVPLASALPHTNAAGRVPQFPARRPHT